MTTADTELEVTTAKAEEAYELARTATPAEHKTRRDLRRGGTT